MYTMNINIRTHVFKLHFNVRSKTTIFITVNTEKMEMEVDQITKDSEFKKAIKGSPELDETMIKSSNINNIKITNLYFCYKKISIVHVSYP